MFITFYYNSNFFSCYLEVTAYNSSENKIAWNIYIGNGIMRENYTALLKKQDEIIVLLKENLPELIFI